MSLWHRQTWRRMVAMRLCWLHLSSLVFNCGLFAIWGRDLQDNLAIRREYVDQTTAALRAYDTRLTDMTDQLTTLASLVPILQQSTAIMREQLTVAVPDSAFRLELVRRLNELEQSAAHARSVRELQERGLGQ